MTRLINHYLQNPNDNVMTRRYMVHYRSMYRPGPENHFHKMTKLLLCSQSYTRLGCYLTYTSGTRQSITTVCINYYYIKGQVATGSS